MSIMVAVYKGINNEEKSLEAVKNNVSTIKYVLDKDIFDKLMQNIK